MRRAKLARWTLVLSVAALTALSVVLGLSGRDADDPNQALIPLTIAGLTTVVARRRGEDDEAEGERDPENPAVAFMWRAANEGEYEHADIYIDPDIAVYANGIRMTAQDLSSHGPIAFVELVEYWRRVAPDLRWRLHEEIASGGGVAVRFSISGTHTGEVPDLLPTGSRINVPASAFMHIRDAKITEVHQTMDWHALLDALGIEQSATRPPGPSA